jgi:DNA repair protein RecO (recombination protein O)
MPLLKTPAISLKSRKWGDADRIVTFYTHRFGKIRGVARGARRMKSRFGSVLEPFVHSELNLFEKRGDPIYRISQADIRESHAGLRADLDLMTAAARVANLVDAVTAEGDAGPKIFQTLLDGFHALQTAEEPAMTSLLFQIRLLGLTGFRPQTDHCAACGDPPLPALSARAVFSPVSGGLVCERCAHRLRDRCVPLSPGSLAFMRRAIGWQPALLTRLRAERQVRAETEAAIDAYVTVVAGRRLPSVNYLAAESSPAYAGRHGRQAAEACGTDAPAGSAEAIQSTGWRR